MGFVQYVNRPAPFESIPTQLFRDGQAGGFWVPRPTVRGRNHLYQDAAGTALAQPGDPVGLMQDISPNGNHLSQSVSGSRPVLVREPEGGRRNLLTWTEDFSKGDWVKSGDISLTDMGGGVWRLQSDAGPWLLYQSHPNPLTCSLSIEVKSNGMDLDDLRLMLRGVSTTQITATNEWTRFSHQSANTGSGNAGLAHLSNQAVDVLIRFPMLEIGSEPTPYQRVTNDHDTFEQGKVHHTYLKLDKVDDNLSVTLAEPITGTMLLATRDGIVHADVDIPAGEWSITADPRYYPGDTLVGLILRDGHMNEQELQAAREYLISIGAGADQFADVESMASWFRGRSDLTALHAGDWDTSQSASLFAFSYQSSLTEIDVSGWDTSKVVTLNAFMRSTPITTLDVSNWDTSSATNFNSFVRDASSLHTIIVNGGTGNPFADSPCTDYTGAFTNTNLSQQSIDDILVAIEAAETSNGTFGQSGGSAPSAVGEAAIDKLLERGWTISVTGGYTNAEAEIRGKMFAGGEEGALFIPKPEYLYQGASGTTPVTADGDPVGLMLDLSRGGRSEQELIVNGDFSDGTSGWSDEPFYTYGRATLFEVVDGRLRVGAAEGGGYSCVSIAEPIAVNPGSTYELRYWIKRTARVDIRIGSNRGGTGHYNGSNVSSSAGDYSRIIFKASGDTLYVSFIVSSGNAPYAEFGNFSLRELTGNHAIQKVSGERPVYRTDGTRHWLEFDGVDDFMGTTLEGIGLDTFQGAFWIAYRSTADRGSGYVAQDGTESGSTSDHGFSVIAPSQSMVNRIVLGGGVNNTTAHQTDADRVLAAAWDRTANEGQYGWDGSRNAAVVRGESYGGALLIGKRGGSSPPHFTGRIYGLAVRSALTDDPLLAQVEHYLANLAGVSLDD